MPTSAPSQLPNYWMPESTSGPSCIQIGALTTASDALGLDSYSAYVNYKPIYHLLGSNLLYRYADRLRAGVEQRFEFDTNGQSLARIRRQDLAQVVYSRAFPTLEQTSHYGRNRTGRRKDVVERTAYIPAYRGTVAGAALRWDTSHRSPISISRDDGQNLLLVTEMSRPFGNDFRGNAYRIDWHGYFPLGGTLGPSNVTAAQGLAFNRRDFPPCGPVP